MQHRAQFFKSVSPIFPISKARSWDSVLTFCLFSDRLLVPLLTSLSVAFFFVLSVDNGVVLYTTHSIATTPTLDTEDASISEALASVNGKRRTTPSDKLRRNSEILPSPLDDDDLIDKKITI
jgi:hypothetical protein